MIKDGQIVALTNSDYLGYFVVTSAHNLTTLNDDDCFSLVSVIEPINDKSFNAWIAEKDGLDAPQSFDEAVVLPEQIKAVDVAKILDEAPENAIYWSPCVEQYFTKQFCNTTSPLTQVEASERVHLIELADLAEHKELAQ
ncbi:hypothetical protein J8B38_16280 [Vibrio parahaemolyticus]|uniref:hypothetical protein n=1 Tax=Vibrio parahaemolyticus TaxID=670 RepID=UPI000445231A|nr:hypothetical protein [Vibrio parahaemolyticus]EGR3344769.1 hypothetical protein [Vibrio parahaemolyticus]ELB2823401.1 hypothetical protein [Vibrio parahaemolyticus]ETX66655.1 hypothetical protein D034_4483 [Vibrio parahaemolyticus Peru-288]KZW61672.1 hypothetical protein APF67_00425 [Vibrio parahaemolyticus]MBM5216288.1 hypothetical protein [Vibrio parahaemolyticus]